jgi:hypothetical protein
VFVKSESSSGDRFKVGPEFFTVLDTAFSQLRPANKQAVFMAFTSFCDFDAESVRAVSMILDDILAKDIAGKDHTLEDSLKLMLAYLTE